MLFKDVGRIRDVVVGPDGYVYLAMHGPDRIARLVPAEGGPPRTARSADAPRRSAGGAGDPRGVSDQRRGVGGLIGGRNGRAPVVRIFRL